MENKYYQIGQVCQLTELNHSTIRFWEKNFSALKPSRSSGGHRFYTAEQVDLLLYLKKLLYEEGYTLEGAKKRIIAEKKQKKEHSEEKAFQKNTANFDVIKNELKEILNILNKS